MMKVGMVSLGCPKNLVDSEVMLGILARHGYALTPRAEEAEVIVVNTCAFIEPAQRESIETILEMAEYKKFGAAKRLVVAGCLVERYRQDILREIPEVDFVIGTNQLERVLEACGESTGQRSALRQAHGSTSLTVPESAAADRGEGGPFDSARGPESRGAGSRDERSRTACELPAPYLYDEFTPRVLSTPPYSAYLKIAEGCDHPCSFCVIPQMRGRFRSRQFTSVLREAENLARQGVRELTIVGQDTTSYGEDLGLRDGLAALLRELGKIPELVWVRFLYCYPNRVTDGLIEAVAETPKVAEYFDIPLQHASGRVLKLMRRGSSGERFLRLLAKLRAALPNVALRSSFIVGFPGETEEDFRALLDFVAAAQFDCLGVFLYSNEQSSASFALPEQIPASVARRRQRQLMALQRGISRRKLREKIGQTLPLLVEGRSEETEWLFQGRLASQAPGIDGQVLINDFEGAEPRPGEFRWATITAAGDYDLVARLEAAPAVETPRRGLSTSPRPCRRPRLTQIHSATADRRAAPPTSS